MTSIDQILALAAEYQKATGLARTTLSWRLFEDTNKLDAILSGKDLQTRRFDRALHWFSEQWPVGAEWPKAIKRPVVRRAAA